MNRSDRIDDCSYLVLMTGRRPVNHDRIMLKSSLIAVAHEPARPHSLETQAQTRRGQRGSKDRQLRALKQHCTPISNVRCSLQISVTDSVTKHTHGPDTNGVPDMAKLYSGARLLAFHTHTHSRDDAGNSLSVLRRYKVYITVQCRAPLPQVGHEALREHEISVTASV